MRVLRQINEQDGVLEIYTGCPQLVRRAAPLSRTSELSLERSARGTALLAGCAMEFALVDFVL